MRLAAVALDCSPAAGAVGSTGGACCCASCCCGSCCCCRGGAELVVVCCCSSPLVRRIASAGLMPRSTAAVRRPLRSMPGAKSTCRAVMCEAELADAAFWKFAVHDGSLVVVYCEQRLR